ncbi:trigger factor [Sulfurospirillum arcachonense]|uniref:trigger factor n=1 Tax=Sulfurospirillum arcachonense TaxID=57666 RepID=UPI00046A4DC1|nr:trigger factor [Sulfurospirillum arcachonense]
MQIKVERIDSANAKAEAKVSASFLSEKQKKMAEEAAKTMKIDGFRKGKVPTHVVLARHGEQIKQDVEQEALRVFLNDALKELDVAMDLVVGEPAITKMDKVDDGLDVEIKISFRPEIDLGEYKALVPEYKNPRILKKDIEERVNTMLKLSAPLKELEEKRAVQSGDFVLIDFEGFIDGVAFEGGKAEKYSLEIGSGSFIPGFEDGIIGMNVGDEKDVKVTFPKEYNSKDLAGKDSVFKVKLQGIQIKDVPKTPSEETLKKLLPGEENPTVETLEAQVKEQLKNEKLTKVFAEEVKPKFVENVLEKMEFALPENIVEQEIDMQVRNIFQNLSEEDIKEYSENPKKITEKREEFRDEATKSVKLTFIVDELAKAEEIKVEDQEVMQMIYFEAMQQGQDPKAYYEHYQKQGVLPAIKMSIIEERLFTQLFSKGK